MRSAGLFFNEGEWNDEIRIYIYFDDKTVKLNGEVVNVKSLITLLRSVDVLLPLLEKLEQQVLRETES